MHRKEPKVMVGLISLGLGTYWPQFPGLKEQLLGYKDKIAAHLSSPDIEIIDVGMIDGIDVAQAAVTKLKGADMIVIYVATYCVSSYLVPFVHDVKVPYLVLNVQPTGAIDYRSVNQLHDRGDMTKEWLAYCQACAIPEISCVFKHSGIDYHIITGHLQEQQVWDELDNWNKALYIAKSLKHENIGILGNFYNGMLDVYTDIRQLSLTFGCHFELLEMCDLFQHRQALQPTQVEQELARMASSFQVSPLCEAQELYRAAATSGALRQLVGNHRLGAMAYYYEGTCGNAYEDVVTSMIAGCTLLTADGIPMAGECEIKNVVAMKVMALLGSGGSFSEFYCMDFDEDVVLLGHDGPAHPLMSESAVELVPLPLYHGKPGKGLSIQMTVRKGDVTLLSVGEDSQGVFLLYAEGLSVEGETLQIGNTNSRYRFGIGARDFINRWCMAGPSHHCAIGIGHVGNVIECLAALLGIRSIRVA